MTTTIPSKIALPPAIKKIMRTSAVFQMLVTAGFETLFVLGAISAQYLTGSDRIAGLSVVTIFAIGQLASSYPAGKWMDRHGRKLILGIGSLIEAVGLALIGLSLYFHIEFFYILGLLLLGLGSGAAQLSYLIGGDIYPPERKAEGLGIMTTFTSLGVVGGTYLVGIMSDTVNKLGLNGNVIPWIIMAILVALMGVLMWRIQPEPLAISRDPLKYYPESKLPGDNSGNNRNRSLGDLIRLYPIFASMGILVCFQGVRMSIISNLSFILHGQGYDLSTSALMVSAMGMGMILAAYPSGWLGDRLGRKKVLMIATVLGLVSAIIIPNTYSIPLLFVNLLLLGAAFSTILNMTRSIFTDMTDPTERGRVMATSMITVGISVIIFPTASSYILAAFGWQSIAIVSAILLLLALCLMVFLKEKAVGQW